MLFGVADIDNVFCSNSRRLLVIDVVDIAKMESIRIISGIELRIFQQDLSQFMRLVDVVPGLRRGKGKFVRGPTDNRPYKISVRVQFRLNCQRTIFVMESLHNAERVSTDKRLCEKYLLLGPRLTPEANDPLTVAYRLDPVLLYDHTGEQHHAR